MKQHLVHSDIILLITNIKILLASMCQIILKHTGSNTLFRELLDILLFKNIVIANKFMNDLGEISYL